MMSILNIQAKRVALQDRPKIHTDAKVEEAATALTPLDLKRLRAVARAIFSGLGLPTVNRDPDDLVAEALARTLTRSRSWRKGVDFLHHLTQSMRSIAWKWREREDEKNRAATTVSLEELIPPGIHENGAAPEVLCSRMSDPQASTIARDLVLRIRQAFADDRAATAMFDGWALGCKGPEIRRQCGMSENALRAAVRRIRRFAIRLRNGQGRGSHGN